MNFSTRSVYQQSMVLITLNGMNDELNEALRQLLDALNELHKDMLSNAQEAEFIIEKVEDIIDSL